MELHSDQAGIFSTQSSFFFFFLLFLYIYMSKVKKATDIAKVKKKSFSNHQIFYAVIKEWHFQDKK